jgi:hypothetical protein
MFLISLRGKSPSEISAEPQGGSVLPPSRSPDPGSEDRGAKTEGPGGRAGDGEAGGRAETGGGSVQ